MIDDFKKLIELQKIDERIHELEVQKEQFPITVENLKDEIRKAEEKIENINSKICEIGGEKKSLSEQIKQANLLLERSQERLRQIKTNKEYEAIHQEIETNKRIVSCAEKRILNINGELKRFESQLETAQNEFQNCKTKNEPLIAEITQKISGIDSMIAEIQKERATLTAQISKYTLRSYEYIRSRRKNGRVISLVSNTDRSCSFCHKMLEMQIINEIRRGIKLIMCESCGSILVWAGGDAPSVTNFEPKPRRQIEPEDEGLLLPSERQDFGGDIEE